MGGLGALLKQLRKDKEKEARKNSADSQGSQKGEDLGRMIEAQNRHNCLHYAELQ